MPASVSPLLLESPRRGRPPMAGLRQNILHAAETIFMRHDYHEVWAGDDWQKFANLRLLFGYMYTQPGKKLLFMGGELGQWAEWNHDGSLEWHLLQYAPHQALQRWVADLNALYRREPGLHQLDCDPAGFEWIDCNDADQSVLSYLRRGTSTNEVLVMGCNFTPVPRERYRIGVPGGGYWRELLNSDGELYGGSNLGNGGGVMALPEALHGRSHTLEVTLPPLAIVVFKGPWA